MQEHSDISLEPPQAGQPVSIAEAARRLGVSERTVYRMLQSDKLHRVSMSDKRVILSDNDTLDESRLSSSLIQVSGNMSDTVMNRLEKDLAARDARIDQLLATQQELTQTIQRMQDQIFELACLVVKQRQTPEPQAADRVSTADRLPKPLRDLFHLGRRRTGHSKTEEE